MKLADMGRCKLLRKDGKTLPLVFPNQSTSNCLTRGIPSRCYSAPEIWSGGDITEKVDVYSFGVICWSMVQNQEPGPCNIDSKRPGHIDPSTLDLESQWPCEFNALLVACWSRDATKRPTFKKIVTALDKLLRKPATSSSAKNEEASSSSSRLARLTPKSTPNSSMKTPRDLARGTSGISMHSSDKGGGWMPPVAEATQHNNSNKDNDDLKPDLPGSPAILNVTRRSFAEKFSKVVADVLPLFRGGHSVGPNHATTSTSRTRSTPPPTGGGSPDTIDMTRKSSPLGTIPGLVAARAPSNNSMSTGPLSTHSLGSSVGSMGGLGSIVDSTSNLFDKGKNLFETTNLASNVSNLNPNWQAAVANRNRHRSALASNSSPVPFSHTFEGPSTMPNLVKGSCSLPKI